RVQRAGRGPQGEGEELQLIYEAKGLSGQEAKRVVDQFLQDKEATLDALSREELGIDPAQLAGSAGETALASFVLFSIGALVPILPFFVPFSGAVIVSLHLSSVALFAVGAAITIFTGAPVWRSGGRQLLLGLAAATLTYAIGHLVGVALA